jgi:hypothetical protein
VFVPSEVVESVGSVNSVMGSVVMDSVVESVVVVGFKAWNLALYPDRLMY